MSHESQSQYLESKILTAAPHQLHLMLIEGALRFGRHARLLLENGQVENAREPLLRTIDIVGEMLAGVRGGESEVNKKLAELYLFAFRRLTEAKLGDDVDKLNEALGVLEYERETWQMVCAKHGAQQEAQQAEAAKQPPQEHRPDSPPLKLHNPSSTSDLSLEA